MKNNVLSQEARRPCTGCGACAAVCPFEAIRLSLNEEGFFSPAIGQSCTGCGLCREVCVKFTDNQRLNLSLQKKGILFSAVSKDKPILQESSSGGAAYELAKNSLLHHLEVIGVKYDRCQNRAYSVIANTREALLELQGSKYLQSCTAPTFKEALSAALNGRKFAVFGTPCQIYGVEAAARIHGVRSSFLFAELFCHGVPSYFLWQNYLNWINRKNRIGKIRQVHFRSKRYGWQSYLMEISGEKQAYINLSQNDPFYQIYFDHAALCSACYNCVFRAGASSADLRLGDFWGTEYADDRTGVSAVVVMSDAGLNWLERSDLKRKRYASLNPFLLTQSLCPYPPVRSREKTLCFLKDGVDIKTVRNRYRAELSLTKRVSLFMKEAAGILPLSLRAKCYLLLKQKMHRKSPAQPQ